MLYVSSACVKHEKIRDSVGDLAAAGFKNIELSGGTRYYPEYEEDLLALKARHGLNYLLHNYFPPPQEDFVLNLGSLDDRIHRQSLELCLKAIELSRKLGGTKFGFHAGFLIDVKAGEIGKKISRTVLADRQRVLDRFCEAYNELKKRAAGVELYVENHVLSVTNKETFGGQNPLLMTDYEGYLELKQRMDFKLLLDVAHLRVSAGSLGLDFDRELDKMLPVSDYLHVGDNDGMHDQSRCFSAQSEILKALKRFDLKGKTVTSETYGNAAEIEASQEILKNSLGVC